MGNDPRTGQQWPGNSAMKHVELSYCTFCYRLKSAIKMTIGSGTPNNKSKIERIRTSYFDVKNNTT
jgi:hypothetical protein